MDYFSYRNLRVYQQSKTFVVFIYDLLKIFPKEENYALCDQLRRAAISIPSNIAEGMGRTSIKEQIHFIEISYGSLNEVMCQLELAQELQYISKVQLEQIEQYYRDIIAAVGRNGSGSSDGDCGEGQPIEAVITESKTIPRAEKGMGREKQTRAKHG